MIPMATSSWIPVLSTLATIPMTTSSWRSDSTQVHVSVTNLSAGPLLEVERISPSAGYIQTPGWGFLPRHPKNINSVVRVEVHENYAVMVTVLHLNLTGSRHKCDTSLVTLVVYESNVTHHSTVWHCGPRGSLPQRRRIATGSDLYVHFRCGDTAKVGFRLFYSVSEEAALLQEVRSGEDLWNCSVPNFVDFRPHFPCDLYPQCVDKEDERDCPYFSEECGLGFVNLHTHCLIYQQRPEGYSWRDMEFVCQQRRMRIASFRTRHDYDRLVQYLEPRTAYWGFWMIAVGIHTSSVSLPFMYRLEMQNSDGTIAFSQWTIRSTRATNVCGSLKHNTDLRLYMTYIRLSSCSRKNVGTLHVVCEIPKRADNIPMRIELPSPSSASTSHLPLVACPLGHVTRDFLACDVEASCWSRDVRSCAAPLAPPPPSLTCANGFESVPYTLVCDVRPDCSDGSDESFCEFPPCHLPEPFHCSDRECVPQSSVCNRQRDCYNSADENLCLVMKRKSVTRPEPPAIVQLNAMGVFEIQVSTGSHLANLNLSVCPQTHFQCPDNGYCMPVFLRCNGVYDCLGKEDEVDCDSYTCPGFYRCRHSQVCVHPEHLCDDIFQCPQHDDELLCDFICPENCTCYGLAFFCPQPFQATNFAKLRFLDGRSSGITLSDLTENMMMIYLSLTANGLTTVVELNFPNLRFLDLSDNQLREIHSHDIKRVTHMETLSLSGNPLQCLFQSTNGPETAYGRGYLTSRPDGFSNLARQTNASRDVGTISYDPIEHVTENMLNDRQSAGTKCISEGISVIPSLQTLDLSRVRLRVLNSSFLSLLSNLHTVNMSGGGVDTLLGEGFQALTQLRALDLRGCPLTYFPRDVFRGLERLRTVYSDNYKLCCAATLPASFVLKNCHAPSDKVSSCEALLRSNMYRVFFSVFACFALLGNASSFVHHVFIQKMKKLHSFHMFMAHLCAADFLMGVYVTIIGVADRLYQGTYLWEDNTWKSSTTCQMAGFLSLVSSEVSALVICLITIDRFLVIRFPFSTFHFGIRSAQMASFGIWGLGGLIAAVPFLPWVTHWQLYSQTGICIPLPISRSDSPGYTYAIGVMILANFVFFLVIVAGQFFIYWSVYSNSVSSTETTRKTQDLTIARRLVTVAMSDFLCWFPIGLLGIMAATGTPISGEVNVAMVIFVLPFNSALNPFLYTLNVVLEKRRKADDERIKKRLLIQFRSIDICK